MQDAIFAGTSNSSGGSRGAFFLVDLLADPLDQTVESISCIPVNGTPYSLLFTSSSLSKKSRVGNASYIDL